MRDRSRPGGAADGCAAAGLYNLGLSPAARVELERLLGKPTLKGSTYCGACNGRYWAMARSRAGGDGVFRDVRSAKGVELGSIAQAKCEVPYGLLTLWRQAGDCIAASPTPPPPRTTRNRPSRCRIRSGPTRRRGRRDARRRR